MSETLLLSKHIGFLRRHLSILPSSYTSLDSNRVTLLFFTISSLDILGKLEEEVDEETRNEAIEWIYRLQLTEKSGCEKSACGFRGSLSSSAPSLPSYIPTNGDGPADAIPEPPKWCIYDCAHISQTYVALCLLLILGDDLSRVDREAVLEGVRHCQLPDGSFCGQRETESDMRFVYCAASICYILNGFSAINMEKMLDFIRRSFNYDGGFGQGPSLESHGGPTYCAIASLAMTGHLWDESVLSRSQIERLKKWALWKQGEGFHGRTNKPDDSCYAFWVGATLKMLDVHDFINAESLRSFLMSAQDDRIGGFSKYPGSQPDALHTYFSIGALSLLHEPKFHSIFAPLNITARSYEHLLKLKMF